MACVRDRIRLWAAGKDKPGARMHCRGAYGGTGLNHHARACVCAWRLRRCSRIPKSNDRASDAANDDKRPRVSAFFWFSIGIRFRFRFGLKCVCVRVLRWISISQGGRRVLRGLTLLILIRRLRPLQREFRTRTAAASYRMGGWKGKRTPVPPIARTVRGEHCVRAAIPTAVWKGASCDGLKRGGGRHCPASRHGGQARRR